MFIRTSILVVALFSVIVRGSLRGTDNAADERNLQEAPLAGMDLSHFYRDAIQEEGLMSHLQALQDIADVNHGNRAAGTTGWLQSTQYFAAQLMEAGYDVKFQDFFASYFEEVTPTIMRVLESSVDIDTTLYEVSGNESTFFTAGGNGYAEGFVRAINHTLHSSNESLSTSGCFEDDFADFQAGEVALIQRGSCYFVDKLGHAINASASAIIIFNEGNTDAREDALDFRFGMNDVPVVFASFGLGLAMIRALEEGPLKVSIVVNSIVEERMNKNIIAETTNGDSSQVIMVGGHMDSVTAGPGINDDGSGAAGTLELALQLKRLGMDTPEVLKNKIRFGFWAAEEIGLLGSVAYVEDLSEEEVSDIAFYINLDMIASPNFVRFVLDGDNSTAREDTPFLHPPMADIEATLHEYFDEMNLPIEEESFADSYDATDHTPFYDAGIPVTGLFTGTDFPLKTDEQAAIFGGEAGVGFDVCYHKACDDLSNVNATVMMELTRASAHVLAMFGSKEGVLFPEAVVEVEKSGVDPDIP